MKNSDKPAFPITEEETNSVVNFITTNDIHTGLTKREYFAGLAMQAMLSNEELRIACMDDSGILGVSRDEAVARYSVMEADALLKQLEQ